MTISLITIAVMFAVLGASSRLGRTFDRHLDRAHWNLDRIKAGLASVPRGLTRKRIYPESKANQQAREQRRRL